MGLERDRSSGLPGVEQLLSRLESSRERRSLSPDAWSAAIIALCLKEAAAYEGQLLLTAPDAFEDFVQLVPLDQRLNALSRLGSFIFSRRGQGWRALLLFALGENRVSTLCAYAAQLAVLNAPDEGTFGVGALEISRMLCARSTLSPAALDGILDLGDLRLLPRLAPLDDLPDERLLFLLDNLSGRLTCLSAEWLVNQASREGLRESVTGALVRLARNTQKVQDNVHALPAWRVSGSSFAVLHEYELPEYGERLRPSLAPLLGENRFSRIIRAFGS